MAFSDTMIIIPSILHADKRAYKLQRSGTDNRGNAPLLCELTQYETYGDGTVQHSNDWCAQFSELVDVCLSLTTAMLAEPNAQHWEWLPHQSDNLDSTALRFALSVKHKESKNGSRQYFSWSERKLTTADKRNDRRFEEVQTCQHGLRRHQPGLLRLDGEGPSRNGPAG